MPRRLPHELGQQLAVPAHHAATSPRWAGRGSAGR